MKVPVCTSDLWSKQQTGRSRAVIHVVPKLSSLEGLHSGLLVVNGCELGVNGCELVVNGCELSRKRLQTTCTDACQPFSGILVGQIHLPVPADCWSNSKFNTDYWLGTPHPLHHTQHAAVGTVRPVDTIRTRDTLGNTHAPPSPPAFLYIP